MVYRAPMVIHRDTDPNAVQTDLADLKLAELRAVHPGAPRYPLAERTTAVPLAEFVGAT